MGPLSKRCDEVHVKGRFYFADGRISEDVTLDDRVKRCPLPDEDTIRWFMTTDEVDPDGFTVLRETMGPKAPAVVDAAVATDDEGSA